MKINDIVGIGEVLIDFTCVSTDGKGYPCLQANPGGAPANFLAAAQKMGKKTAFIGKVGNDAFGKLLLKTLEEKNIDTKAVKVTDDAFTTLAFVTLDEKGDREFSFARKPGADSTLQSSEVPEEIIKNSKILHMGSLLMTTESGYNSTMTAVKYAKANGTIVSYDPNYRAPLWDTKEHAVKMMAEAASCCDMMKISEEEAELIFGTNREESAKVISEKLGLKLIMVTLGPDGAIIRSGNEEVKVKAPKVNVIDTCGAGDICGGSLAAGLLSLDGFTVEKFLSGDKKLSKDELTKIGTYAVWAASKSTEKHGGIESVPDYCPQMN